MPIEARPSENPTHYLVRVRTKSGNTPSYRFSLDKLEQARCWHADAKAALYTNRKPPDPIQYGALNTPTSMGKLKNSWTLQEAFDATYNAKWSTSSTSETQKLYFQIIADFFGPHVYLANIHLDRVESFVDYLYHSRSITAGTVNRYLSSLSTMWKYASDRNRAPQRVSPWPMQKEPKGRQLVYSEYQERQIFKACRVIESQEFLEYLVLLLDTGMRRGELESLTAENCIQYGVITLGRESTKNNQARTIYLTPRCHAIINSKLDITGNGQKLFSRTPSWYRNKWLRVKSLANLPTAATMHSFRHTFASRLAQSGNVNLLDIKEALGHKSIEATLVYAHLCMDGQKRAINSLTESSLYYPDSHQG
jgi:integrase